MRLTKERAMMVLRPAAIVGGLVEAWRWRVAAGQGDRRNSESVTMAV